MLLAAGGQAAVLIEFGCVLLGIAVLGRLAGRFGLPSIPLYILAGLFAGTGGVVPLDATESFIRFGSDLGVVLLLLLLGLEYSIEELQHGLRSTWQAGVVDLVANFPPGFVAGLLLGWGPLASVLLGGITYISSSGIIAKLIGDLDRMANRETPIVLSILVIEDLAMAVYLPIVAVLLVGGSAVEGAISVMVALVVVFVVLMSASRLSAPLTRVIHTRSPELLLLTVLGVTFVVAGVAESLQISAAVGAFLLGVTLSGKVAEDGRALLMPIRDVFGGLFFVFFGLQIDPGTLPGAFVPAALLAVVTALTKGGSGYWAAQRAGIGSRGRLRAALSLVPRGEFSIVIAGLGVAAGLESDLGSVAAAYVLLLAIAGSIAMRFADQVPLSAPHPTVRRRPPSTA